MERCIIKKKMLSRKKHALRPPHNITLNNINYKTTHILILDLNFNNNNKKKHNLYKYTKYKIFDNK